MSQKSPEVNWRPTDRWNEYLPPVCSHLELLLIWKGLKHPVCHGPPICKDTQLLPFNCMLSVGCGNCAGTLCPQTRKKGCKWCKGEKKRPLKHPHLVPALKSSWLAVDFFSTGNFPHDGVRSVVKRTVSGNGFWSSQDIIMRYQHHRMLFLNVSFPN